jgi:hypothetical protein
LTVGGSRSTVDADTGTMELLTGLVLILVGAAMVKLVVSPGTERAIEVFAAGFVGYRDPSALWPRGVQEEEPVAWSWSGRGRPDPPGPVSETAVEAAELIEISGDDAPLATRVDRRSILRGMARRPH